MPAGSGTAEYGEPPVNDFASDTHRRVCANLSVPRSAAELAEFLFKLDPYVDPAAYGEGSVEEFLKDLEADGLVKNVGTFADPGHAVRALREDDDLPTLPKAKAEAFTERAERDDVAPYLDAGDHWVMTQAALDRINGPVPDEAPALKGPALKHAEEANARLAEEDRERVREGLKAEVDRLRARAKALEEEAKKL